MKNLLLAERVVSMLKNIDSNLNRTMQKASLQYDKEALKIIIENGYVTNYGTKLVHRQFHSKNYSVYMA